MQKIQSKYTERLVMPSNAVSEDMVETWDGVKCRLKYISTMNNERGDYNDLLDDFCQELYECPFSSIRSIWIARLGSVSDFWNLVEMEKIDD